MKSRLLFDPRKLARKVAIPNLPVLSIRQNFTSIHRQYVNLLGIETFETVSYNDARYTPYFDLSTCFFYTPTCSIT